MRSDRIGFIGLIEKKLSTHSVKSYQPRRLATLLEGAGCVPNIPNIFEYFLTLLWWKLAVKLGNCCNESIKCWHLMFWVIKTVRMTSTDLYQHFKGKILIYIYIYKSIKWRFLTSVVSSLQTSLRFERQATLPNVDNHDTSTSIITPYLAHDRWSYQWEKRPQRCHTPWEWFAKIGGWKIDLFHPTFDSQLREKNSHSLCRTSVKGKYVLTALH